MGIFLMEKSDGTVDFQLYADPDHLDQVFKNLKQTPKDEQTRATMLRLDFKDGKVVVSGECRELPVEPVPAEERPDGLMLGGEEIFLPKDDKEKEDGDGDGIGGSTGDRQPGRG